MIKRSSIDQCTGCTSCVIECPVTAATREFRGPKLVGPALERFRLFANDSEASLEYCTNCKTCDITCPSNVPVSTLNMLAKAAYYKKHGHKLRDWVLAHNGLFAKLASPVALLANFGISNAITQKILSAIGIAERPLPVYAASNFYRQFKKFKQQAFKNKVVFYPGCYIGYNDPQVGMDLVTIMQANQYEVIVPDIICCGTPIVSNGYIELAEEHARHNITEIKRYVDQGYPVLTACTSCGLMLKQEYLELFNIDGAAEVAAHHYEASEFLLELYDQGVLNIKFTAMPGKYLYHAPCHMRAQGIGLPSLELLSLIPGLSIAEADAGCCGIAGSYGFKKEKYDVAMKIGQPLFEKVITSSPDAVVTECGTCRLQIEYATKAKTVHPLSLLRAAYH